MHALAVSGLELHHVSRILGAQVLEGANALSKSLEHRLLGNPRGAPMFSDPYFLLCVIRDAGICQEKI